VVALAAATVVFGPSAPGPTRSPTGGTATATRARPPRTISSWTPHAPGPAPQPIELPAARAHTPPPIQGSPEMAAWVVPLRGQPPLGEGWDPQADVGFIVAGEGEGEAE
jgi:hypothetical protein